MTHDEHKAEFMATLRQVPKHHIVKAMGTLTPGIDWTGCSKGHMADEYARMKMGERLRSVILHRIGQGFHLDVLKRRALSRERGDSDWHLRK